MRESAESRADNPVKTTVKAGRTREVRLPLNLWVTRKSDKGVCSCYASALARHSLADSADALIFHNAPGCDGFAPFAIGSLPRNPTQRRG
jgi:hypothetical protein